MSNSNHKKSSKIFTENQIGLGTFFATPFAGLLMLGLNFKRLGNTRAASQATTLAFILLPPLCYLLNIMFEQKWCRLLAFLFAGLMMYVAENWQGKEPKDTIHRSAWATLLIT